MIPGMLFSDLSYKGKQQIESCHSKNRKDSQNNKINLLYTFSAGAAFPPILLTIGEMIKERIAPPKMYVKSEMTANADGENMKLIIFFAAS